MYLAFQHFSYLLYNCYQLFNKILIKYNDAISNYLVLSLGMLKKCTCTCVNLLNLNFC